MFFRILRDFEIGNRVLLYNGKKETEINFKSLHLTLQRLKSPVNTCETEHKVQGGFREEKGRVKII